MLALKAFAFVLEACAFSPFSHVGVSRFLRFSGFRRFRGFRVFPGFAVFAVFGFLVFLGFPVFSVFRLSRANPVSSVSLKTIA